MRAGCLIGLFLAITTGRAAPAGGLPFNSAGLERQTVESGRDYGPALSTGHDVGIGPTIDVTVQDDRAYAIGKGALHVLDLSNPARPKPTGRIDGLGNVRQLVVEGDHAYVVSREDGLFIVNIKDPANPVLMSRHDTIEFGTGVCKSGDVLFVACRTFGVELIDVSDPQAPRHLSLVRTGEAQSVVARNGILYAGVWAASQVVSVDVRNPWQPRILSRTPLDGFGDGVDVAGEHLFAATGHHSAKRPRAKAGDPGYGRGHGLEILSLKDPAKPEAIARVKFPRGYDIHNDMWSVTVANHHAFVADTHNGVFVLDVNDPAQPKFMGHWNPPASRSGKKPNYAGGLCPGDGVIYAACGQSDLHVIPAPGIARPPAPRRAASGSIPPVPSPEANAPYRAYTCRGQVYAVDFTGDIAIAACGADGIHVLKIKPAFEQLSRRAVSGKVTDVCVKGARIYVAEGSAGLGIYELPASGVLRELGRYPAPNGGIRQVEVPGDERYAMVQVGIHKIHILDVTQAAEPRRVLEDQNPGLLYGDQMMRGAIDGRYACAFWHVSGLHWYDLKAEGGPAGSGDNFPGRIGSGNGLVEFQGKTLATTRGGYLLLERSERRAMADSPLRRIGEGRENLGKPEIANDRLYLADRQSGLVTIADIADSEHPKRIDQFELPGNPGRPVIQNGTLIIADGYHGLLVFDPLSGAEQTRGKPSSRSGAGESGFRTDRGGVVLTFDDRNFSDWTAALPLFEKYGVKVTFFISGAIDEPALAAARKLLGRGHAIGAHGLGHRKAVEHTRKTSVEEYLRTEIHPQLAAFRAAGIQPTSFAYPSSQNNTVTDQALLKEFRHLRTGGGLAAGQQISGQDRFYVPAGQTREQGCFTGKGIDYAPSMDDRTFEQIDAALVRAAGRNEILALYAHGIAVSKRGHHVTPEALEHIFRKARELKLPFYTFDQLP